MVGLEKPRQQKYFVMPSTRFRSFQMGDIDHIADTCFRVLVLPGLRCIYSAMGPFVLNFWLWLCWFASFLFPNPGFFFAFMMAKCHHLICGILNVLEGLFLLQRHWRRLGINEGTEFSGCYTLFQKNMGGRRSPGRCVPIRAWGMAPHTNLQERLHLLRHLGVPGDPVYSTATPINMSITSQYDRKFI